MGQRFSGDVTCGGLKSTTHFACYIFYRIYLHAHFHGTYIVAGSPK